MSGKLNEGFLALFGGPIAWFLQLCAGFALASQPCFSAGEKLLTPRRGDEWTWPAMITLMAVGVIIALASLLVSSRVYKRSQVSGGNEQPIETAARRTGFLALWGMLLGAGFALATLLTAVAFITQPRCAG